VDNYSLVLLKPRKNRALEQQRGNDLAGQVSMATALSPDRHPTNDFFICDVFDAAPKDDLGSMEHPIFSLSTKPDRRVLHYAHNEVEITVTPSVKGRATIHDKDILIYCISQLVAAQNAGREISRRITMKAHDFLIATNRDTGGDSYTRLRESFDRLAGTRITTNMATGGVETTQGFGLIESWEIRRKTRGGRMISVSIVLSEWLFRAVLSNSVLTLSRDYFRLRKPLDRRIYELARKHCGRQADWRVSVATLHKKAGSAAPLRVFRAALRAMIVTDHLPGYSFIEAPGDLVEVRSRRVLDPQAEALAPRPTLEALESARLLAPGMDVHALEAEWRHFWTQMGRRRLSNPDRAFLGWVRRRMA
jgi:plasmid replication initiation protein